MNDLATHVWKNACLAQQPIFFSVDYSVDTKFTNFHHQDKQSTKRVITMYLGHYGMINESPAVVPMFTLCVFSGVMLLAGRREAGAVGPPGPPPSDGARLQDMSLYLHKLKRRKVDSRGSSDGE